MKLLDVKPFQETLHSGMCGPAVLKMALDYYGVEKSGEELSELCGTDPDIGTDIVSLKRAAENLGFKTEVKYQSTFDDIQTWLDKKVPVIVDWFSRGRNDYDNSSVPDGHYSPVVGLDEKYIYLQDPEIGKLRKIFREDFLGVWFDFDGTYIKSCDDISLRPLIAVYREG